jgi:uncharacterized protein YodC (DUF2158 family)
MNDQFEPGDVVQPKSGGSLMTVSGLKDGRICCEWLDEQGTQQMATWSPSVLQSADDITKIERVIVDPH